MLLGMLGLVLTIAVISYIVYNLIEGRWDYLRNSTKESRKEARRQLRADDRRWRSYSRQRRQYDSNFLRMKRY